MSSRVSQTPAPASADYDVAIIGGAWSGAATAVLLRRFRPECRVLIVEREERFSRKVGEATVEISGFFVSRVLGQWDHLARRQLVKHGLRFWLSGGDDTLATMTEIGPNEQPELPSFQLDRAAFDEHLLATAEEAGCDVLRPARVAAVEHGWPTSELRIACADGDDDERRVRARWVIDASGRHAFLARRKRLRQRVEEHPTAAAWGRWRGALDLDGPAVVGLPPVPNSRRLATNHFTGHGWWCWVIPLAGGETSIGVVWDKRHAELAGDGPLVERYREFLARRPGLREIVADATLDEDDFHGYSHLPYRATRYADRGWALVGDAAAFIDPFYSPGLDHAAMSTYATARLVAAHLDGLDDHELDARLEIHNGRFVRSYDRMLEALYRNKYELMGDAELLRCAFLVDTALYHRFVVAPVVRDMETLAHPMFGVEGPPTWIASRVMGTINRRLVALARRRRKIGIYGRRNHGHRYLSGAFGLGAGRVLHPLWRAFTGWIRLELETLFSRRSAHAEPLTPNPSPGGRGA